MKICESLMKRGGTYVVAVSEAILVDEFGGCWEISLKFCRVEEHWSFYGTDADERASESETETWKRNGETEQKREGGQQSCSDEKMALNNLFLYCLLCQLWPLLMPAEVRESKEQLHELLLPASAAINQPYIFMRIIYK